MALCNHSKLVLLPEDENRFQCEHCCLTIKADELGEDYCPECFETFGKKRYDFEEIPVGETVIVKYRCEDCGVIIESE